MNRTTNILSPPGHPTPSPITTQRGAAPPFTSPSSVSLNTPLIALIYLCCSGITIIPPLR
ncbi:MAG: hypothetical protein LC790_00260 [Actinobacteria bacterium]|nr:hypothetical protein [Actinomycetota bacterium]